MSTQKKRNAEERAARDREVHEAFGLRVETCDHCRKDALRKDMLGSIVPVGEKWVKMVFVHVDCAAEMDREAEAARSLLAGLDLEGDVDPAEGRRLRRASFRAYQWTAW